MKVDIFSPSPDGIVARLGSVDTSKSDVMLAKLTGSITALGVVYGGIIAKHGKAMQGYAKQSDLEQIEFESTTIPENFAGLEAVMVPTRLQNQLFRIYEVVESDDYVTIRARHVWYDNLQNYTLWKGAENTDYTGAAVCRNILENGLSPVSARVASDCTDTMKGTEFDYERKNLVEAYLDPENGVCAKFGLSLIRNNWDFYCLKAVGYNRGFVVENGKNLLGVERKESIEPVITRVAAYGKKEDGDLLWLDNNGAKWVDSENIGDYSYPRVEILDTGLQIGKDDVTAANIQAKMLAAAQKRFTEDHVDLPTVEMRIEFISLGDTEEYAQYRGLDKVYLYDILSIKDTVRGYQYTAQVVAIEHDILTGMLLSATIGDLDNWDGTRKIAVWQVPEINGENIRLKSILAGAYADGSISGAAIMNGSITANHIVAHSITADEIAAHTITAAEIAAGSITADRLDAEDLAAAFANINVLNAAIADIAEAEIGTANIGFAQIKDANVQNLIAHDAVTDKYYIHKLAVENAQIVQATVGELIVKASDNKYYRLDIDEYGALSPTEVTNNLTNAEITAGVTSDGRSTIIETDLTVADLSATNMKAINALIDQLTAARIDVDELFARQATITALNTVDIRGNQYLQLMVEGYGITYVQLTDPASEQGNTVKNGDVWYKGFPLTWGQMESYTWAQLESYTYADLEGYVQYIRKGGAWVEVSDPMEVQHTVTTIGLETDRIAIRVEDTWNGLALLSIESSLIEARVQNNEGDIAALVLQANQFALGLSNAQGDITTIEGDIDSLELAVGNKYTVISGIAIASAGVSVTGNKYINLDVNSSNYVHINQSGIEVMGNRIKVNGKYVFDREDIIIMNPNSTEVWRRTVAGIESQMNGKHDWVLIRPYYDARIIWNLFATYTIQASSVGGNVAQLQQEAGLAASFGTSTTYQYVFKFTVPTQNFTELGLGLTLANDQQMTSNVVTTSGTYQISAVTPTTIEMIINSAVNLCSENAQIFFKLEAVGRNVGGISDVSLTCKCDSTVSRVPCSTYYYV